MREIIADENQIRIDTYIANKVQDLSRSNIQKLLNEGKIFVNGNIPKSSYKVQYGDKITIQEQLPQEIKLVAQNIQVDIIYQDDNIAVVNKPKGMVVHPGAGNNDGTLVNALLYICKNSLSGINGEIRPGIVHRLDKDTSGILVVAKDNISHINLSEQIKNRQVKKTYIALVRGIVNENEATVDMPIARHRNDRQKMAVDKQGKNAITHFKVLKRYEKYTLLEVNIETGRTHQIRVHLSEIGHPVVGDEVYSNGKNEFDVHGQMLHSKKIMFKHPITNKIMEFEAELPEYFKKVLEQLGM